MVASFGPCTFSQVLQFRRVVYNRCVDVFGHRGVINGERVVKFIQPAFVSAHSYFSWAPLVLLSGHTFSKGRNYFLRRSAAFLTLTTPGVRRTDTKKCALKLICSASLVANAHGTQHVHSRPGHKNKFPVCPNSGSPDFTRPQCGSMLKTGAPARRRPRPLL